MVGRLYRTTFLDAVNDDISQDYTTDCGDLLYIFIVFSMQQGPDSDDSTPLTLFNGGGENAPVRGHAQVWADITKEVGRRFRYSLRLYNNQDTNDASRTSLLPLLRRVCQRSGIRLY